MFRAAVPQRGYARIQVPPRVLRRLHRQHLVRQRRQFVAGAPVAYAVQVDMGIDKSGQDGGVAVVDFADGRALRRLYRLSRADLPDGVAFEQDGGLFLDGFCGCVNQAGGF